MLEHLLIRNIALFEEASVQFGPGLHVLTGETGAGKSLVVDSVNFLCGAKADKELIRAGSEQAYVEGIFNIAHLPEVREALHALEMADDNDELILSRELSKKGRSVCRVNGMAVALSVYTELTQKLIDLHGQHEHQSLLQDTKHLRFLDLLGDSKHNQLLEKVRGMYQILAQSKKELQQAQQASVNQSERMEILQLRQKELKSAKLIPGEEESLQEEKAILRNADKLVQGMQGASDAIQDAPNGESALSLMKAAVSSLDKIANYSPAYAAIHNKANSLYYELEELSHDISVQMRTINRDDRRLEEVETRLDQLLKLQRKYGASSSEMLETLQRIEKELARFNSLEDELQHLEKQVKYNEQSFLSIARVLSEARGKLAKNHEKKAESILHELNMGSTRFQIKVESDVSYANLDGIDRVSMLIAPNVGEDLKPLSKIASGGELSRVMLAMKTMSAEKNEVPTMVFDEIDTGISGKTSMVIAQKLWDIGRYRQVICVSHMHQLASMASNQYLVSKAEADGRTKASITALEEELRVQEIAKMLGDVNTQGESSLKHASVLLEDAKRYRSKK